MIAHYVVTRININYQTNPTVKNFNTWFDARFKLLENICAPSIASQTKKNFTWLMLVAPKTSPAHLKKLQELEAKIPNAKIITKKYSSYIKENLTDEKYVITSRIDSDDALRSTYIEDVQNTFMKYKDKTKLPFIINYSVGAYYYPKLNRAFKGSKKWVNQFVSFIEPVSENLKTVHCQEHGKLDAFYSMIWLPTKEPMWVWVIHDMQISPDWPLDKSLGMLRFPEEIKDFNINNFVKGIY